MILLGVGRIFLEFEPINYIECIYLKNRNILEICIGDHSNCTALTTQKKKNPQYQIRRSNNFLAKCSGSNILQEERAQ